MGRKAKYTPEERKERAKEYRKNYYKNMSEEKKAEHRKRFYDYLKKRRQNRTEEQIAKDKERSHQTYKKYISIPGNREKMIQRAKDYYQKHKQEILEKQHQRYVSMAPEKKRKNISKITMNGIKSVTKTHMKN